MLKQLTFFSESIAQLEQRQPIQKANNTNSLNNQTAATSDRERMEREREREREQQRDRERDRPERIDREHIESPSPGPYNQSMREPPPPPPDTKPWSYPSMDLINSGAAFWQNYSGKFKFLVKDNLIYCWVITVLCHILNILCPKQFDWVVVT